MNMETETRKKYSTVDRDRRLCRFFSLKFNRNTDADILEYLDKQPTFQGYIKSLIRADMAKQKENHNGAE